MSGNKLYDEISEKTKDSIEIDYELLNSVKHLEKQYLENIFSILLCFYIECCVANGYDTKSIITYLNSSIPFNGKILNVSTGRGLSFKISDFPQKVLVIISYYLKNYFKWETTREK